MVRSYTKDCKPGITGFAQISGRDVPYREKTELDRQYVQNRSLGLDLKCLLKTIGVVLRHDDVRDGAREDSK